METLAAVVVFDLWLPCRRSRRRPSAKRLVSTSRRCQCRAVSNTAGCFDTPEAQDGIPAMPQACEVSPARPFRSAAAATGRISSGVASRWRAPGRRDPRRRIQWRIAELERQEPRCPVAFHFRRRRGRTRPFPARLSTRPRRPRREKRRPFFRCPVPCFSPTARSPPHWLLLALALLRERGDDPGATPDDTDPNGPSCTLRQAILSMNGSRAARLVHCRRSALRHGRRDCLHHNGTHRRSDAGTITLADLADTSGNVGGTLVVSGQPDHRWPHVAR